MTGADCHFLSCHEECSAEYNALAHTDAVCCINQAWPGVTDKSLVDEPFIEDQGTHFRVEHDIIGYSAES